MARNPTAVGPGNGTNRTVEVLADGSMVLAHAAAALSVTSQTIRNWIEAGCPHIPGGQGRGNVTRVKIGDVMAWRVDEVTGDRFGDGDLDLELDKAREKKLQVIRLERNIRVDMGSLVPVDLIADAVEADYSKVRSRLSSIPSRICVQVAAEENPAVVRAMIKKEINEALKNLSSADNVTRQAGGDPDTSVHDPIRRVGIADQIDDDISDEAGDGDP